MIGNQPTIVIKYCQLAAEFVWTQVTLLPPWYMVAETKPLRTLVDSDVRGHPSTITCVSRSTRLRFPSSSIARPLAAIPTTTRAPTKTALL